MVDTNAFELAEVTLAELADRMAVGELSSRELTAAFLDRIDRVDPSLGSIIEVNPDALDIAAALDDEQASGGPRGPLHGIPVVLKDNIDTHDAMTTTAGSLALEGSIPAQDSFVAARLRAAGAVLLAKANMSEWANFRGKPSTSGWSARGGQCHNPYVLDHNPCGSSSGSAVAVSANLAPVAIGTETAGSIVCPSSVNGIVGLKPTVGLWSRSGIIPISHVQDTAGPMGRCVADVAALLGAAVGADPNDPATAVAAARGGLPSTYALGAGVDALRGARLGVVRSFEGFDDATLARFDEALDVLADAGAQLVDPVTLEGTRWGDPAPLVVLEYEFKAGLDAYLAGLGPDAPVRSLAEVISFNERHADRELVHFGHEHLVNAQARGPLSDPDYRRARADLNDRHRAGLDAALADVDALVMVTRDPAWPTDHDNGDPRGGSSAGPAAIAGYPNLTVPMGFVEELPVGIGFVGRPWSESTLLSLGHHFERLTGHRRVPRMLSAA